MSPSWIIAATALLAATIFCSYLGDDDIVYQYLYRKPTSNEGLRRIRWVLLKTFASIYGGFVVAAVILWLLLQCCSLRLAGYAFDLVVFACIALMAVLIGVIQNVIRRMRGRPTRPLIDRVVWQRSSGPLKGQ